VSGIFFLLVSTWPSRARFRYPIAVSFLFVIRPFSLFKKLVRWCAALKFYTPVSPLRCCLLLSVACRVKKKLNLHNVYIYFNSTWYFLAIFTHKYAQCDTISDEFPFYQSFTIVHNILLRIRINKALLNLLAPRDTYLRASLPYPSPSSHFTHFITNLIYSVAV